MKSLNEFLNEAKSNHSEIEKFLKTKFKKVSKITNSGVIEFYCDKPKTNMPYWTGVLKVVVGRDGLSSIEGMDGEVFDKDELFKEVTKITADKFFQESLSEGQTDKIEGMLANPNWTVVTYPRKISGSKAEAHRGKIVSIKGTKLVVNFGGKVGGTAETLDVFKDIAVTYDNIGYNSTYTVLDSEIIANADKENIYSFMGRSKVTKFAALDQKEFDKAVKGTAMGDYMNKKDILLNEAKGLGGEFTKVKDLTDAIVNLPDTIKSIEIPTSLDVFGGSTEKFTIRDYADDDWKKDAVNVVWDTLKLKGGKDIDKFYLRSYFGPGKPKDPFYVQFSSKKSRQFADDMSSGKYGSLD